MVDLKEVHKKNINQGFIFNPKEEEKVKEIKIKKEVKKVKKEAKEIKDKPQVKPVRKRKFIKRKIKNDKRTRR